MSNMCVVDAKYKKINFFIHTCTTTRKHISLCVNN